MSGAPQSINRRMLLKETAIAGIGGLALGASRVRPALGQDTNVQIQVVGPGQVVASGISSSLVNPPSGIVTTMTFNASDWHGGFHRNNSGFLGRPWTAIYGAQSQYPRALLALTLASAPTGNVTLTLVGISDESGVRDRINVTINSRTIYTGPAWFQGWNGAGNGQNAIWTTVVITTPANYFQAGVNRITVANLHPGANFSKPPYVDLGAARLVVPGTGGAIVPGNTNVTVGK